MLEDVGYYALKLLDYCNLFLVNTDNSVKLFRNILSLLVQITFLVVANNRLCGLLVTKSHICGLLGDFWDAFRSLWNRLCC